MYRYFTLTLISILYAISSSAAKPAKDNMAPLPHKVEDITLIDLNNQKCQMPNFGKKNLLIFYVDPDVPKQNNDFIMDMEMNRRAAGENIYGFGIINLKDSWYPLPDNLIRKIARKRTEKNGATIISDPSNLVSQMWQLGDCNNKFVLMLVSKEGELVYMMKGEFTEEEKSGFYEIIDKYR